MNQATFILCLLTFVYVAETSCYSYWNGDKIPTNTNSSYCQSIITWPVSDEVLSTSQQRNAQAIQYYQAIYNNSYLTGDVTVDCLGMIQYIACATTYPTCDGSSTNISSVCSWLCDLMSIRCGTSSQLYIDACLNGNPLSQNCSNETYLLATIFLLFCISIII